MRRFAMLLIVIAAMAMGSTAVAQEESPPVDPAEAYIYPGEYRPASEEYDFNSTPWIIAGIAFLVGMVALAVYLDWKEDQEERARERAVKRRDEEWRGNSMELTSFSSLFDSLPDDIAPQEDWDRFARSAPHN